MARPGRVLYSLEAKVALCNAYLNEKELVVSGETTLQGSATLNWLPRDCLNPKYLMRNTFQYCIRTTSRNHLSLLLPLYTYSLTWTELIVGVLTSVLGSFRFVAALFIHS